MIAGTLPFDVTGANAGQVIGASNGGGIQVIYDSDGSVLGDFMGAGFGVLGIASPEFLAAEGSTEIVEGWLIIRGEENYKDFWPDYTPGEPTSGIVTHEFGHAINLAHTQTNGYYSRNQGNPDWGTIPTGRSRRGPTSAARSSPPIRRRSSSRRCIRSSIRSRGTRPTTARSSRPSTLPTTWRRCRRSTRHPATRRPPARSRVASWPRTGRASSPASTSSRAASTRATVSTRCRESRAI